MNEYSYSIVIVTYNRLNLLKEALEHALQQSIKPQKIIVVNNCSTDGTTEYLNEVYGTDDRFILHHEDTNIGGAGGFHKGLELAIKTDSEWFMITDDDAILDFNCMEEMNPEKAAIKTLAYACTVKSHGDIDISHRRKFDGNCAKTEYDKEIFKCELATFCGLMINRSLVEKIGLPKSEYFIWFDDTEYCMRILKESEICVIPKAVLNHKVPVKSQNDSTNAIMSWKSYYGKRNSIDMFKTHKKFIQMLKVEWGLIKIIIKYLLTIKKDNVITFNAILSKDALWDGIRGKLGKNDKYLP